MATVYIAMSADIIHHGHINLIERASKLGELTVGILTDEVVANYKRYPLLNFEERLKIIGNIKGVGSTIKQDSISYEKNLRLLKPDYVVHGDDWRIGIQQHIRQQVIDTLAEWGGELIEIPYTHGVNIEKMREELKSEAGMPDNRRKRLKDLIANKDIVRAMEAHNGLTGLIVENTRVEKDGIINGFDAIWISSLCDSTIKGKPDIELVDMTSRINTINEIFEVTTKPIILDGDTGGIVEHFEFNIRTLERIGVSAVIIEDKIGLKKNSLFGNNVAQTQDTIESFCNKLSSGKKALKTREFMLIARIESLILGAGIEDALTRAKAYINAGASGIMIHSREKIPDEIFEFCRKYQEFGREIPLVVVPTTFNKTYESELIQHGVKVVIYANQLIRSAFPAMTNTARMILENSRAYEADQNCMPIKEILNLIPGGN